MNILMVFKGSFNFEVYSCQSVAVAKCQRTTVFWSFFHWLWWIPRSLWCRTRSQCAEEKTWRIPRSSWRRQLVKTLAGEGIVNWAMMYQPFDFQVDLPFQCDEISYLPLPCFFVRPSYAPSGLPTSQVAAESEDMDEVGTRCFDRVFVFCSWAWTTSHASSRHGVVFDDTWKISHFFPNTLPSKDQLQFQWNRTRVVLEVYFYFGKKP